MISQTFLKMNSWSSTLVLKSQKNQFLNTMVLWIIWTLFRTSNSLATRSESEIKDLADHAGLSQPLLASRSSTLTPRNKESTFHNRTWWIVMEEATVATVDTSTPVSTTSEATVFPWPATTLTLVPEVHAETLLK